MITAAARLMPMSLLFLIVSFGGVFLLLRAALRSPAALRSAGPRARYAGVMLIAISAIAASLVVESQSARLGLLAAALATTLAGTLDERRNLSPASQLLLQLAIAFIVVISGWQIHYVTHPAGEGILYLTWLPLWGSVSAAVLLITIGWLVFIMNCINWLDGSDGLASSVAVVAFLALGAVSVLPASANSQSMALAAVGLGSSAAFLLWNWPPARVYLGTSGAWWLGLFLGLTAIASGKIVTTMLVLAWPTLDAMVVVIRRLARRRAPWRGDVKNHLHHRLLAAGVRPAAIALFAAALSALSAGGVLVLLASRTCLDFNQAAVSLPGYAIPVALADTPAEQSQGLSGCRRVPANHGLYFAFSEHAPRTFWMRGMVIPIDIVWIADGVVVGLNERVPPPAPDTADADLLRYSSTQPVNAVLELAAGEAQRLGLTVGTFIRLNNL